MTLKTDCCMVYTLLIQNHDFGLKIDFRISRRCLDFLKEILGFVSNTLFSIKFKQ